MVDSRVAKTANRRVLGSMNDFAWMLEVDPREMVSLLDRALLLVYEGRKSIWALSHSAPADRALRNAHFAAMGLDSLEDRWRRHPARMVVPVQLALALG